MSKKTTGNNTTELVFILDKSGSMAGMEADTIGGFNAMIEKQKAQEGKAYVSTFLFANQAETLHDRLPLGNIVPLTSKDYQVGGCTALLDAIGCAIEHITTIHKYARKEDVPQHTMFIITTDGMENASKQYTKDEINCLISKQKELGWEFVFVAANIDAVETAKGLGIRKERAVNYRVKEDTQALYSQLCETVCEFRREGAISDAWNEDFERKLRNKK
ncbi:MAG: VWA domain-containing protein [Clostridia bacterium]|nr:VWA domain-containing protein [Clostridia bacterium]